MNTIKRLNDKQIDVLYHKLVKEDMRKVSDAKKNFDEVGGSVEKAANSVEKYNQAMKELGEDEMTKDDIMMRKGVEKPKSSVLDTMNHKRIAKKCRGSVGVEGMTYSDYSQEQKVGYDNCILHSLKSLQTENYRRKVRRIEENILSLLSNEIKPTMTKKDLIIHILESTAPAPTKTPTKAPGTKEPKKGNPFKPKHEPRPKGEIENMSTAPAPTKTPTKAPGTKEPNKGNPFKPKHEPRPKGKGKQIPEFLKFDNLNIEFRNEKKNK